MVELSIVIPCLNEEETIGICLKKACTTLENNKINYEIIVADNGSRDNSVKIALSYPKVKVITVERKGYGITLRTGITHSQGKYILMADADDSYDFGDIMKFLNKIKSGYQLVQGCRFPSGGGTIVKGAMPISHKIFGNPFLSKIAQIIYKIPFKDIYCGMRCFEKEIYLKKNYFSDGMTFAVENLIKLVNSGAKSTEVGITLYKDGRIKNKSHLRTIKDGLKTLKLLLICSPKWLYFYPSIIIFFLGLSESYRFFLNNNNYNNFEIIDYIKIIKIN
jgi:glycosyltransferase involved in cell wall biosynthesis